MTKSDIAEVVHATLYKYNSMLPEPGNMQEEATAETRKSYISGIEWVMNNPATTAEQQHEAWVKYKQDNGWVWGREKNPKLKTHPLLIPWHKVSLEHRVKDSLFISVVLSLLPMQNFLKGST